MFEPADSFEVILASGRSEGELELWEARVRVLPDPACVEGHFPGDPVVPGVAQLLDVVDPQVHAAWPDLGPLLRVSRVKFLAALRPGDDLTLILRRRRGARSVQVELRRGREMATKGAFEYGEA